MDHSHIEALQHNRPGPLRYIAKMTTLTRRVQYWMMIVVIAISTAAAEAAEDCPECVWDLETLIRNNGYPLSTHTVTCEDGFQLTLFHISHGRHEGAGALSASSSTKPAVLLQHGLLDTAGAWTLNLPEQSLAYMLADQGFDVWIGNSRGSTYSPPACDDLKCWDFSFDEMGKFDVPANIRYVLEATGQHSIGYVGHSQGCTQMFVHLSSSDNLSDRINLFVALEPAIYEGHITSLLLKTLAELRATKIWELFRIGSFGKSSKIYEAVTNLLCTGKGSERAFCDFLLFSALGADNAYPSHNLNNSRIPLYANHYPGGTSVKNMEHWVQHIDSGKFEHFDYGWFKNLLKYGSLHPPAYDLSRASVPLAVFSGGLDALADPVDISRLMNEVNPDTVLFWKELPNYDHADAVLGLNANRLIYDEVITLLHHYQQQQHQPSFSKVDIVSAIV